MKINSVLTSVGGTPDSGKPRSSPGAARPAPAPAGEQVALSSLSTRLQEIGATMASSPVVNAERVAEIKQAIAEGRFKVDPEKIADGLLDNVRQMLGRDRQPA